MPRRKAVAFLFTSEAFIHFHAFVLVATDEKFFMFLMENVFVCIYIETFIT